MNDGKVALMVFIACDVVLECVANLVVMKNYYYESMREETKDVFKRLFR